ncbi:hypothetical protein F4679DRAFT_571613 [Xylaria curta]|nr:hypothetical protein F4679DRAFT_571613 [Xylaria curta]
MDGDLGYHLMSTNVPRELLIHRNQQPPHRKQARTWRISTWTTAAASASPRTTPTTSTLVSPPIATTATATPAIAASIPPAYDNDLTTAISTDTDAEADASVLDTLGDIIAVPTPAATGLDCAREALNHRGRYDGHLHVSECGCGCPTPTSPEEQSTAAGRPSFGDHRPRLFGRSARRRTTSLTRSPVSDPSHARSSSSSCGSYSGPSSSDKAPPVARRATAATVPLVASTSPPDSALRLQSNRDDTVPHQNHASLTRQYWRDPFHRRSTHQSLSPSIRPRSKSTKGSGIHGYHGGTSSPPISDQAPYLTQHPISGIMPSPRRNSSVGHQSGVMASNETLLSSSAERSGALSTASNATSTTSKPAITQLRDSKAFVVRNGRTYINDPTLPYPLPVDLPELHRQSLRTLLMFQLFGGPILSSVFASRPPTRVLDVGCGAGFWSMMCHRYFAQHGHSAISFTGLDIVPLGGAGASANAKPDKEMRWQFVQHDIRQLPWPFADGEFDLVMYLRVLKPGGVLEYWETDSIIRMLRPHAPKNTEVTDDDASSDGGDDEDNAERMGAYVMTNNTPISQPLNPYLVEYNGWSSKALEARGLSAAPCTSIGPSLLQEAESLMDVQSKRLAVPLSEIRWEREGVGGVVTKDGKSYIDSQKGKFKDQDWKTGSTVTPAQSALRRTALETTVSFILALEPLLREVSLKSQEEWDTWAGKMTNDLLREGGTSWGECLEVGVWTSRKRHSKT